MISAEKQLVIHTDENVQIAVSVNDAPELFEAWVAWRNAERASSKELHFWQNVIDTASEFLASTDDHFGEAAEDVTE